MSAPPRFTRMSCRSRDWVLKVRWMVEGWRGWSRLRFASPRGMLPKSVWRRRSAAVSAAARSTTPKPVEFRALIWQSWLLRVGHPRSVPFGQHAPEAMVDRSPHAVGKHRTPNNQQPTSNSESRQAGCLCHLGGAGKYRTFNIE
jgi:hypothetical protein